MIPKIIHYIWFGSNPYSEKIKYCIESWKKYLPEYEFMLWNENSFDVNSVEFTKQAYENKKWAFVSDYVRVWALNKYGGVYLDTDVEIRKPLDTFLNHDMVLGTDERGNLTAFMASIPNHPLWENLLNVYQHTSFKKEDGSLNQTVNNLYIQDVLKEWGYQEANKFQSIEKGIVIYPDEWFHAVDHMSGIQHITVNTYAIHWHTLTWTSNQSKIKRFIRTKLLAKIIGGQNASALFFKLSSLKNKFVCKG